MTRMIVLLLMGAALVPVGCGGEGSKRPAEHPAPTGTPGLFAYDRSRPLDARTTEARATKRLRIYSVRYRAADGAPVPGLLALPRAGRPPYPCVIYQGGLGFRPALGFEFWNAFAGRGFGTFSIAPRYHGERATPTVNASTAVSDPRLLERMLRGSVLDLRRGLDYLATRPECQRGRTGYVGISFGAMLGALLAGADQRVMAPALVVGGGDWRLLLRDSPVFLRGLKLGSPAAGRALRRLADVDPARWVGRISPRPVLMINGRLDGLIPASTAGALHAAAKEPKRVIWYPGAHNPFAPPDGRRVTEALLGWLTGHLGPRR